MRESGDGFVRQFLEGFQAIGIGTRHLGDRLNTTHYSLGVGFIILPTNLSDVQVLHYARHIVLKNC